MQVTKENKKAFFTQVYPSLRKDVSCNMFPLDTFELNMLAFLFQTPDESNMVTYCTLLW